MITADLSLDQRNHLDLREIIILQVLFNLLLMVQEDYIDLMELASLIV